MYTSPPASALSNSTYDAPVPPPGNGYAPISLKFIFFISFFFSGAYSALLVALNWKRLGKPERFLPTLIIVAILNIIFTLIGMTLASVSLYASFFLLLLWALPALIVVVWQRPTYMAWIRKYGEQRANLQRYGCFTSVSLWVVCGVASYSLITYVAVPLFTSTGLGGAVAGLIPVPSFEGQSVEVTYPAGWVEINEADFTEDYETFCETPYQDCLRLARSETAAFEVLRLYDITARGFSLIEMQTAVVQQLQGQGADIIDTSRLTIDDYAAYQVVARQSDNQVWSFAFVKPESNYMLRFALYTASRADYDAIAADYDALLASVDIITGE